MYILTVLNEIISVLFSKSLVAELIKPQAPYGHEEIRAIIEDVAQSSAMRLDPVSMTKLWELITMVFKWQITLSHDLMAITCRHLRDTKEYTSCANAKLQIQRVQNIVDNFKKVLSQNEQAALREEILEWLKTFNVRVSLLLRLGLQNNAGTFIANNNDAICSEMLKNLGENIYAVTQNGKVLARCTKRQDDVSAIKTSELKLFADEIVGEKSPRNNSNVLKLSIDVNNDKGGETARRSENFDKIMIDKCDNKMAELLEELNVSDSEDTDTKLTDDLLDLIKVESES